MNKRLDELKDKGAQEHLRVCAAYLTDMEPSKVSPKFSYAAGFDAAIAELMPRVERLVEALNKVQCNCTVGERMSGHNTDCFAPYTNHALAEWREFIGTETLTKEK